MADSGSEHDAVVTPEDSSAGSFLLKRMIMNERLGRPFQAELYLLSDSETVDFTKLVGRKMGIQVKQDGETHRQYHGYVARFVQADRDNEASSQAEASSGNRVGYRATLVPWLWMLSHTRNCKIWQEMTVPDIIKEVFSDLGFTDFEDKLSGTYKTWTYCVQYNETAFNFVQRLMEHEGIYYYFKHGTTAHTMVLADGISAHDDWTGGNPMVYRKKGDTATEDHIKDWTLRQHVRTGKFVTTDYDFEDPSTDLEKEKADPLPHGEDSLEVFDYPGHYMSPDATNGQSYADQRLEALHAGYEICSGRTDNHFILIGGTFELVEHDRSDQNRDYLVTATKTIVTPDTFGGAASGGAGMSKSKASFISTEFETIVKTRQFRLLRETPWPKIGGPQTAKVVGEGENEIWTDEYGRIKVQFHWDRFGEEDENSSCWIRVAQRWAGQEWGIIHIPRVGQEVIVDFLDGDPNQPLVTGAVYNSEQMPPYALPDNQTQSGIKTRSSDGGDAETFNELRFEDKTGEEEIYLHAEKNMKHIVENDYEIEVGLEKADPGDLQITVENELRVIVGDCELTMNKDGTITLTGMEFNLETTADVNTTATGKIASEATGDLTMKSSANFKAEGSMSEVKASGPTTVKGAVVNIN